MFLLLFCGAWSKRHIASVGKFIILLCCVNRCIIYGVVQKINTFTYTSLKVRLSIHCQVNLLFLMLK